MCVYASALAEDPRWGTAATGSFIYLSTRKWRQEETTSSSLPPPLTHRLPISLHHSPGAGGAATRQDPPTPHSCPGKGFQQQGVRLQLLHPLTLSRSRMVVKCVSRISLFQSLTQHWQSTSTSAYVPSLYVPVVHNESHPMYASQHSHLSMDLPSRGACLSLTTEGT